MAEDRVPDALTRSGFEKVTAKEVLDSWEALGMNFTAPDERWPTCDVTIQSDKLVVKVRKLTYPETQEWRPQKVNFDTDMTSVNKVFKEPTHMMPVGEDWLCAYAYGEFGNRCWLFSKAGEMKALVTKNQIVTLATVKGRFFATTYDSEKHACAFSELVLGKVPQLEPLNEFDTGGIGFLKILPSPGDETLFLIDQGQLVRWNVITHTSIAMRVRDQCFVHLASDAHSACEAEGRFWIGGPGFVCGIDPTAPDLALSLFVPKGWRSGAK
ncbi:MAG: hypothetical protein U1F71_00975 [Verrucomicrobiaceae bacterium]